MKESIRNEVNVIVAKHIQWVGHIEELANNEDDLQYVSSEDIADTHRCDLGRWIALHEIDLDDFYQPILKLHEQIHNCAAIIISLAKNQNVLEMQKEIGSNLVPLSSRLITLLCMMKKD
jgi:hypothetical protein